MTQQPAKMSWPMFLIGIQLCFALTATVPLVIALPAELPPDWGLRQVLVMASAIVLLALNVASLWAFLNTRQLFRPIFLALNTYLPLMTFGLVIAAGPSHRMSLGGVVAGVLWCVLWIAYLVFSKRVREVFVR